MERSKRDQGEKSHQREGREDTDDDEKEEKKPESMKGHPGQREVNRNGDERQPPRQGDLDKNEDRDTK